MRSTALILFLCPMLLGLIQFSFGTPLVFHSAVKRYPRGTTAQIVKSVAPNDAKTQRSSINSSRSGPKTSNSVSANAFSATAKTAVATSDTGSTTSTIASSASRGSRSSQLISNLADLTALNFLLASLDPNHSVDTAADLYDAGYSSQFGTFNYCGRETKECYRENGRFVCDCCDRCTCRYC